MQKSAGASTNKLFSPDLNWDQPAKPERHVQLEFTVLHGRCTELPAACSSSQQVFCSGRPVEPVPTADAALQPHDGRIPSLAAVSSPAADAESPCCLLELAPDERQPHYAKPDQPLRRRQHDHQRQPVRPHASLAVAAASIPSVVQPLPDSTTSDAKLPPDTASCTDFL